MLRRGAVRMKGENRRLLVKKGAMTGKLVKWLMLGASLGLLAIGARAITTPAAHHQSRTPCVFGNSFNQSSVPCAPFTRVGIRVLSTFASTSFGNDTSPVDIATLYDGSVMVKTEALGLDRIAGGRLQRLWQPNQPCVPRKQSSFTFGASFDDQVLLTLQLGSSVAVRADGSLAFRLPRTPDSGAQDANGVVWLVNGHDPGQWLYAYFPSTRSLQTVRFSDEIFGIFRSANGRVYATNSHGLYELDSHPTIRARLVHRAIQVKGDSFVATIQGVGTDGSLWAATPDQVVHERPDGTMHVMRFAAPTIGAESGVDVRPTPIKLMMARDGTIWIDWLNSIARIDNNDRIEVVTLPQTDEADEIKVGQDSTVWVLARDTSSPYQARGIVNFVPAAPGVRGSAWPFQGPQTTPTPVLTTPCPPNPTPIPPLPPKSGSVNFVYVANAMSHDVWGYWTDSSGNLTPVRGSPFAVAEAEHFTIDPSGRHLYVGTTYGGIFGYTIDARNGTLRAVPGSPFASASGSLVLIDHLGRYAYSANRDGKNFTGYAIDQPSGTLRPLAWSPLALNRWPFRMLINPQRNIGYVATDRDIETFYANGSAPRPIASIPLGSFGGFDILFDPRGRWAYLSSDRDGTIAIYGVDQRSGALGTSSSPPVSAGSEPRAMVETPDRRFLYVTNIPKRRGGPAILGYSIDSQTGALHALPTSPFSGSAPGNGITVTPDGAFLYATNFSRDKTLSGFAIDRRTGALWRLPKSPFKSGDFSDAIVSCRRIGDGCKTTP